jgi:DNA repair exonuclease SbcCD ATPase subunit
MPRLKIKELTLRNFRSYGDYDTTLQLDTIGQVLIVGQKDADETKSNGSGKTSLVDSIIWCLFGRLPNKDKPSDWVINWYVKKDCTVKITTCDGYVIERTRNVDGHDDLLIADPTGKDISLSTNQATQLHLNKLFDLDYDIFVNSVFFTQAGFSFLELNDQKRKKALERMLSLTRFDYYSQVAKDKVLNVHTALMKSTVKLEQLDADILKSSNQIEEYSDLVADHEGCKELRIKDLQQKIPILNKAYELKAQTANSKVQLAKEELAKIHIYDINKLQKKWDIYTKIVTKLDEEKSKIDKLMNEVIKLTSEKETLSESTTQNFSDQIKHTEEQIGTLQQELEGMPEYDIEQIQKAWDEYNAETIRIEKLTKEKDEVVKQLAGFDSTIELLRAEILKWRNRIGTVCPECQQPVDEAHVKKESNPYLFKFKKASDDQKICAEKLQILKKQLDEFKEAHKSPSITHEAAEEENRKRSDKITQIETTSKHLDEIKKQQEDSVRESERITARLKEIDTIISGKKAAITERNETLITNRSRTAENMPKVSVSEAESIKKQYDAKQSEITSHEDALIKLSESHEKDKNNIMTEIETIKVEVNPYQSVVDKMIAELDKVKEERKQVNDKIFELNKLERHLTYIQHVYSDRRCIKSFVLSDLIPFFNERIRYYLETFECDTIFEFNSFLQIKNDKWPYEFWSGGEKKGIDVAIMLAIHDLHESIYEKQCNILIFDEVDGKLDISGVHLFVNLLLKDFSTPDNSVIVISHKDQMKDMFPTKICVKCEDKMSRIEEVR